MKKTLFAILIAIVAMMCPGKASAELFKYTAYKMTMMTYDDDGDEAGWTEWVNTPYSFVLDTDKDIVTFMVPAFPKGDYNINLVVDDYDDWEESEDGGAFFIMYCHVSGTEEEAEVTIQITEDGQLYILLEADEVKLAFMCKDAGKIRTSKKKSSTNRSKRRR